MLAFCICQIVWGFSMQCCHSMLVKGIASKNWWANKKNQCSVIGKIKVMRGWDDFYPGSYEVPRLWFWLDYKSNTKPVPVSRSSQGLPSGMLVYGCKNRRRVSPGSRTTLNWERRGVNVIPGGKKAWLERASRALISSGWVATVSNFTLRSLIN